MNCKCEMRFEQLSEIHMMEMEEVFDDLWLEAFEINA